jgi:hypothetical protein
MLSLSIKAILVGDDKPSVISSALRLGSLKTGSAKPILVNATMDR